MASIEIIAASRQRLDSRWANNGETEIANHYDRFYLLKSGRIEVIDEDGSTTIGEPGCVCLFTGGPKRRRYRCVGEMDLTWLHLQLEFRPGLSPFNSYVPPSRIPLTAALEDVIFGIARHVKAATPSSGLIGVELVSRLYRPFLPEDWSVLHPDQRAIERMEPALDHMERNVSRSLTLDELARTVSLHPTYFSNLFRATFGTPPLRYHMGMRMRRSQSLLLKSGFQGIAEVARASGFEDPLHFSRVFRCFTGISPSLYRKRRGIIHP